MTILTAVALGISCTLWGASAVGISPQDVSDTAREVGRYVAPWLPPPWDVIVQAALTLLAGVFSLFSRKHARSAKRSAEEVARNGRAR